MVVRRHLYVSVPRQKMVEGTPQSPGQAEPRTEAEHTEANASSSLLDRLRAP